jgi:hypothetical protein
MIQNQNKNIKLVKYFNKNCYGRGIIAQTVVPVKKWNILYGDNTKSHKVHVVKFKNFVRP